MFPTLRLCAKKLLLGRIPPAKFPFPKPLDPPKAKDVTRCIEALHVSQLETENKNARMFAKNNPDRIRPGAVLMVRSYVNGSKDPRTTSFAGYLMKIRRRGPQTSILLRNKILDTYVEAGFKVFSPSVKEILVINQNGLGKRPRRAYLSYLRKPKFHLPSVTPMIKDYFESIDSSKSKTDA
ncbi:ribosomal protein subunit L19 [Schizosaccharomyces japonicus yFS275]|uniref:Ribosomal protein subunit L19 n=1 Tax=Schizosaccharomyces japonicus (strain yFS275 / FY16936) TaxID=402676 RepID=B6JY14_SCHJY|nr:ribosomal protein subunit L19 [Schizosaccharomyces japonicus yFS275]EEB06432.1 ribosomal protein subunit L19 [Schizosaccharomyces japonicus yFS275]